MAFDSQARTYRLNRGPALDSQPRGFDFTLGSQRLMLGGGFLRLPAQAVLAGVAMRDFQPEAAGEVVWLAAPKTTDSTTSRPLGSARG